MKTTVEMAKEAGFTWEPINNIIGPLERFEALIRADEREACAKVCDERYMGDNNREDMEVKRCAEAIRARGLK
jgi:hypothetical protein